MSMKYRKLTEYLANLDRTEWMASFEQIEEILGFALPDSARQYQAWWSNQMRSQSLGWQSAGWKATALDLKAECVTFVYVGGEDDTEEDLALRPLTIREAKEGLAATFGIDPDQVEITIRA
ncbi:MAG: hypothetical protein IE933_14530 [Sphingomonadales bacterium]|nr:hypothetical protein [Sphingomonadales bacterium]MBD3775450.1 hypothetical protein [Paracoccaceae bacterium]